MCDVVVIDGEYVASARSATPSDDMLRAMVGIHGAIADETRLRILLALSRGEACVCDLAAVCGITQSGVSHQLRILRDRDLVTFRRDGKRAVYRLSDEHVRSLLDLALEHAEERTR